MGAQGRLESAALRLNGAARVALRQARTLAGLTRGARLVAVRVTGPLGGDGEPIALGYLGRRDFLDDFEVCFGPPERRGAVAREVLFEGDALRWRLQRPRLEAQLATCDLIAVETLLKRSGGDDVFHLTPYLRALLRVEASTEQWIARVRNRSQRRRMRRVSERPFSHRVSRAPADLDLFYDGVYAPYARWRFGAGSHLLSRDKLAAELRRGGEVILVEEGGALVSGAVLAPYPTEPATLVYLRAGVVREEGLPDDELAARNTALDLAVMAHAAKLGKATLDYELTSAFMSDGIFKHKARLGCAFAPAPYSPLFRLQVSPRRRAAVLARTPVLGRRGGAQEAWVGCDLGRGEAAREDCTQLLASCRFESLQRVRVCVDTGPSATTIALQSALEQARGEMPWALELSYGNDTAA